MPRVEGDAGFGDAPPFALGLLALLRGEGREIGVEVGVAAIGPVELAVLAQQPARAFAGLATGFIEEEGVRGGEPVLRGDRARESRAASAAVRVAFRSGRTSRRGPVAGVNGTAMESLG